MRLHSCPNGCFVLATRSKQQVNILGLVYYFIYSTARVFACAAETCIFGAEPTSCPVEVGASPQTQPHL